MPVITTLEYAQISNTVKRGNPVGRFSPQEFKYSEGFINNGFWGCIYVDNQAKQAVVAFKGTGSAKVSFRDKTTKASVEVSEPNSTMLGDITADLKLAVGIIPNQASTARKLFKKARDVYNGYELSIVGHSLGGYLAQVVSYWYLVPCVTFNAPGAWGDLQKAKVNIFKPQVMWRTIKSSTKSQDACENFIHKGDPIGNYGLHRGGTHRISGWKHGMADILKSINSSKYCNRSPFA